jgi:hypothetical protein
VPQNDPCPVSVISMISNASAVPSGMKELVLKVPIIPGTKVVIGTATGPTAPPLINLQASVGGAPCVAYSRIPQRLATSDYVLATKTGGCEGYGNDNSSLALSVMQERAFYDLNNPSIVQSLPYYADKLVNEQIKLYARFAPKISDQNCATLNFTQLNSVATDIQDLNNVMLIMNVIAFILPIISVCSCASIFNPCARSICESFCCMIIAAVASLAFCFIYGILSFSYQSEFNTKMGSLSPFRSRNCFDTPIWNKPIFDFTDPKNLETYQKCFEYPQFLMYFAILLLIAGTVMACCLKPENRSREYFEQNVMQFRQFQFYNSPGLPYQQYAVPYQQMPPPQEMQIYPPGAAGYTMNQIPQMNRYAPGQPQY